MINFVRKLDKLFILIVLGNVWIWKIFNFNLLIALIVIVSSWFLLQSVGTRKVSKVLLLLFLILLIFQFRTTKIYSLSYLTEQEKLFQIQRLKEYPLVYIQIFNKHLWIPAANWFEEKPWVLSLYKIRKNLTDVVSPNLYFFSNHPNERVEIKDFEKFPYILLPFFVVGFLNFDYRRNLKLFLLSFIIPLLVIALIGQLNPIGPFILFPFVSVVSFCGLKYAYDWFRISEYKRSKILIGLFVLAYFAVFIQTIFYARS